MILLSINVKFTLKYIFDIRSLHMATWNSRGLRGSTLEDMVNKTNEKLPIDWQFLYAYFSKFTAEPQ